jgi:peptide/nickel transport system substrate-binding protein
LAVGEVDLIELPVYEQYPFLKNHPDIQLVQVNPLGFQNMLRFNHLQPPFDNPAIRQAAMAALNQPDVLKIQVGFAELYRACFSVYPCNTAYATTKGMEFIASPDPERARRLLQESGYDGTAVVILHPTDQALMARMPLLAAQLLRQAGFKVDLRSMDYNTVLSRRAKKDGWSIFITYSSLANNMDPINHLSLSGACSAAWFGWPCDSDLENLRTAFALAGSEGERKSLAEQIQVRAMEIGAYVPLGEFIGHVASRKSVKGLVPSLGNVLLWNVEKN